MDTGVFEVICNKDTNKQELKYLVSNGSGCTDTREEQSFTITVGKGDAAKEYTIKDRPTGEQKTMQLLDTYTTQNVYVSWKNENGNTGDCYANVTQCEHPTPHVVVPKLELMVTFADPHKEYINRFYVNYDIKYQRKTVKSSTITPPNRFECSEKVTSHTETVDSSTFDDGEISNYILHFDIISVNGWTTDCNGSYTGNYEFLWQTIKTDWTDIKTLDINLADAPYNPELGMITLQLLARQKQN